MSTSLVLLPLIEPNFWCGDTILQTWSRRDRIESNEIKRNKNRLLDGSGLKGWRKFGGVCYEGSRLNTTTKSHWRGEMYKHSHSKTQVNISNGELSLISNCDWLFIFCMESLSYTNSCIQYSLLWLGVFPFFKNTLIK